MARIFESRQIAEKLNLLGQQRILLSSGLEAAAELMETSLYKDRLGSMLKMRLWLKLKKCEGSFA